MLETLNIISDLSEKGVQIIFVRQPELSTTGPHTKLLLAIYSYFAEAEREYISLRTKQGLAAAKAQGKQLGRPKGSRNKERALDPYKKQIRELTTDGAESGCCANNRQQPDGEASHLQRLPLLRSERAGAGVIVTGAWA